MPLDISYFCEKFKQNQMNKIKYAFLIVVIAACGNNKPVEVTKTPQEQAVALRDSAVKMAAQNKNEGDIQRSLALLDEAMALDPENKAIYTAKMNIYSKSGDYESLSKVLEDLDGSKVKDPYYTLQLGMEYELQGNRDAANTKYSEAVDAFLSIVDTMQVDNRLRRNTFLMNAALASTLSESDSDRAKLDAIMSDAERENLSSAIEQLDNVPREDLLNQRRKKQS
jgi:tetratricopeptide (TPR) repeat protein